MKSSLSQLVKKTKSTLSSLKEHVNKMKQDKDQNEFEKKLDKLLNNIPQKEQKTIIHISSISVARAAFVILLIYLLYQALFQIREIILIVFISLLFSSALDPAIDKMAKKGLPRALSIILIYILIFIVLGLFMSQLIPLVASQTIELANKAGQLISNITSGNLKIPFSEKIQPFLSQFLEGIDQQTIADSLKTALLKVGEQLQSIAGNAWKALKVIFNGVFNVVLVLLLTFFLVIDDKVIEQFIRSLFPARHEQYILEKSKLIKIKTGNWLRGQITLVFAIGILTFIGLSILKVEYAVTLAMIAGIMELIPVIGPMIAAIPAILIAVNTSGWLVLWVLILYIVIQQLENNILVPVIMKKAVGIHPIIIILAMLIGAKFLGILGVILAVPVATILSIFVKDYSQKQK